jgi:subtilisin family serine protease
VTDTPRPESAPDVFAQAFRLFTPERILHDARATGQGVSVCVIDSGVEQSVLEERQRQRGHAIQPISGGIFAGGASQPLPYCGHQSSPHGTTVADIILMLAPQAQLYSADVFGARGSCQLEDIFRALHWAIHVWRCKIVNLSLGVPEHQLGQVPRRYQLLRAIEEAYYNDVLVIAAAGNDHPLTRSYPAVFAPPLISVDKKPFRDPLAFAYELREQIEFQADGRGELGPFAREPATSWAVPHLSGIAARILSLRPNLKPFEMKTILYWLSRHYEHARNDGQIGDT